MADYRVLYTNLVSGDILGELPVRDFSVSEALNAPGAFSLTLPLEHSSVSASDIVPAATGVYFERDGVILWGGILWTTRADVAANTMEMAGEGFLSYFRRRFIASTLTYSATYQENIAKGLIDHAQTVAGGDIGVQTASVSSGKQRDRTYLASERKNIGEAIEQLANVDDGFDFAFTTSWSGGSIVTNFETTYPDNGRSTNYVFEMGSNVLFMEVTKDGTTMSTVSEAIGAGIGDDALIATKTKPTLHATYPRLEVVQSFSDVRIFTTLQDHAQQRLNRGSRPMEIIRLQVYPDTYPGVGVFSVGDLVKVRGSHGLVSVNGTYRIMAYSLSVPTSGAELVEVHLVPKEVF